jgi:replication factor A1
MEGNLIGRYFTVTGPRVDRYILVETIAAAPAVTAADVDELLAESEVV